jgi:hypothetical protein
MRLFLFVLPLKEAKARKATVTVLDVSAEHVANGNVSFASLGNIPSLLMFLFVLSSLADAKVSTANVTILSAFAAKCCHCKLNMTANEIVSIRSTAAQGRQGENSNSRCFAG